MVDPDVPQSSGAFSVRITYLHWHVQGAQPSCIANQRRTMTVFYQPPSPIATTQHRYKFLVYREPADAFTGDILGNTRLGFDVNDFARRKNLTLVGRNFL